MLSPMSAVSPSCPPSLQARKDSDSARILDPFACVSALEEGTSTVSTSGVLVRGTTLWTCARIRRINKETSDLLAGITGEDGDVPRDPELAFGESTLSFQNVGFQVAGKSILEDVSGHFEPGSLVAMMGPSGCGKTTLLDILAGKKSSPSTGKVHFNGRPRDSLFRRMTAYVPQHDVMPAMLTVQETVKFVYDLKQPRPSKLKSEAKAEDIESRLMALGLSSIRDSRIGDESIRGISGGQRRRVSLARGLAAGAQIIFADEPTSGLSATDAETCIRYMRLLAHRFGITIIVVIHQPRAEVSRLFDHLLLLTANPGRLVYNGPMKSAADHWAQAGFPPPMCVNPTDYFLDLVTPGVPSAREDLFVQFYQQRCKGQLDELLEILMYEERKTPLQLLEAQRDGLLQFGYLPPVQSTLYAADFSRQLRVVFQRHLTLTLRDHQGFFAEILGAVAKAAVVGAAYWDIGSKAPQLQLGFIFMLLCTTAIDGLKVMPKIIGERLVMKMETSEALYSQWAYIISFTVISGVLSLIANTLFVSLLFSMSGISWRLFKSVYLWTTSLQFLFDSLYLMIAAIAKDATSAQIMSLPFLMLFLLYNGFTVSRTTVPSSMAWAIRCSPVAYAMEGLAINFADDSPSPEWDFMIQMFGYERESTTASVVFILCIVVFRTVQVFCLRCLNGIQH